jgi:ribonuclease HI
VGDRSPRRRPRRSGRAASDGERRQLARAARHARRPPDAPTLGELPLVLCDGGSRGNPGPAAVAAVLVAPDGAIVDRRSMRIGRATAAEAEYRAMLLGLELAAEHGAAAVDVRSDSRLAIAAIEDAGEEGPHAALVTEIRAAAGAFSVVRWRWHPRGENEAADALVRQLLW